MTIGYGRWGYLVLALVCLGAMQTVQGQEREEPVYETGDGTYVHSPVGDPAATIAQMRLAYKALKSHSWDMKKVPQSLLRSPDHSHGRQPQFLDPTIVHSYEIPTEAELQEIAISTSLYFRSNEVKTFDGGRYRPEGFFLVMYKDGRLFKVPGEDARLYPIKGDDPSLQAVVFPGMKCYSKDLPRLPFYQEPWYEGPSLD